MADIREDLQRALGTTYTIERELGGGGMSIVFVATDNALGREVVIKVLPQELAASVSVDRFKREIMLSAALQHPHIVPVLSSGQADQLPYFIMPYVDGESVRARMARGPLSVRETVSILKDVARALAYAHGRGVIHRDIKPDNILLSGGAAVVTDFGVAKAISASRERVTLGGRTNSGGWSSGTITSVGTSLGTPMYMAPEQAAADPNTDHRADLYALGVVGYEMLVGAPPFYGRTPQALLAAQLTEAPKPISSRRYDVPPALADLLMRMMEKDPAKRPRTAQEVARLLDDPSVMSGEFTSLKPPMRKSRGWQRRASLVGVVAVLLTAGLAAGTYFRSREARAVGAAATAAAPAAAKSIAVLPLVNIGGDTSDVYFAEGMTAQVTTALSKLRGLRVAARTAASSARDKYNTPDEIGKALNVSMLLEGTVQRESGRLRVTARLINIADGATLWSDMFERQATDLFKVQDDISNAIVAAVSPELGTSVALAGSSAARGTDDLQAYDLYLRGRFFFQKRGEDALRSALAFFEQASARDPAFAKAYTGIADVYAVLPLYTNVRVDSVLPLGLRSIDKAIALDSTVPEAYASRANLLSVGWRWGEAERDYQRALALDPNYATAHQWYGEMLLVNGRVDEALAQLRRATELDPLSPVAFGSYGLALGIAKRDLQAQAAVRHALDLDSTLLVTRMMAGAVQLYGNRVDEAIRQLEPARQLDTTNPFTLGVLGYAYGKAGRTAQARDIAKRLETSIAKQSSAAGAAARVYLGLGDTAQALTMLERAAAQHDMSFSTEVLAEPFFDPIRHSPRFAAVVTRVGLDRRLLQ
ncbi:MAG TPA: protein kinase [Gemmatimonadaceae bacterium]|nr:protein kinase [Gemmatimonadaceae bacterium]